MIASVPLLRASDYCLVKQAHLIMGAMITEYLVWPVQLRSANLALKHEHDRHRTLPTEPIFAVLSTPVRGSFVYQACVPDEASKDILTIVMEFFTFKELYLMLRPAASSVRNRLEGNSMHYFLFSDHFTGHNFFDAMRYRLCAAIGSGRPHNIRNFLRHGTDALPDICNWRQAQITLLAGVHPASVEKRQQDVSERVRAFSAKFMMENERRGTMAPMEYHNKVCEDMYCSLPWIMQQVPRCSLVAQSLALIISMGNDQGMDFEHMMRLNMERGHPIIG